MAYNILVIEDDQDIADLFSMEFSSFEDVQLTIVKTGNEALEKIEATSFDTIFTDLRLPGCNGMQLITSARNSKNNKKTPIYVVSGYLDPMTEKIAQNLDVTETIAKPMVNFDKTVAKVHENLVNNKPLFRTDGETTALLVSAARTILGHYLNRSPLMGKTRLKGPASPSRGQVTAVISFHGEGVKGSLALSANLAFIKRMAHVVFGDNKVELDKAMAKDIMGELCNQVVGHLKTLLIEHKKKISIGLPMVYVRKNLTGYHSVKTPILFMPMGLDKLGVDVELAMTTDSSFVPAVANDEEKESATEGAEAGDVLLF